MLSGPRRRCSGTVVANAIALCLACSEFSCASSGSRQENPEGAKALVTSWEALTPGASKQLDGKVIRIQGFAFVAAGVCTRLSCPTRPMQCANWCNSCEYHLFIGSRSVPESPRPAGWDAGLKSLAIGGVGRALTCTKPEGACSMKCQLNPGDRYEIVGHFRDGRIDPIRIERIPNGA